MDAADLHPKQLVPPLAAGPPVDHLVVHRVEAVAAGPLLRHPQQRVPVVDEGGSKSNQFLMEKCLQPGRGNPGDGRQREHLPNVVRRLFAVVVLDHRVAADRVGRPQDLQAVQLESALQCFVWEISAEGALVRSEFHTGTSR